MGCFLNTEELFSLSLLTALIGDIGHTKPLIGFCMLVSTQTLHRYLCYVPNHRIETVVVRYGVAPIFATVVLLINPVSHLFVVAPTLLSIL